MNFLNLKPCYLQVPLVLFLILLNVHLVGIFGQSTHYVEGESLWRNQGYGVENHEFQLKTRLTILSTTYTVSPEPITGSCGTEYYSTSNLTLYNSSPNLATISLRNRPHSVNNVADYTNGVNASDLIAIQGHINNTQPFSGRTPTDDEPYRKISADADYDHDIDANDVTMIQQLLLGIRSNLARTSWEWVLKDWVEDDPTGFAANPYEFVIHYLSLGSADGLAQGPLTTNQILGDNDKYLTYRTTKIGDIIATSGNGNDWVCGTGVYLQELQTRSTSSIPNLRIRKGSTFTIGISMEDKLDLLTSQIPLFIDGEKVKILGVKFYNNFSPSWNYNQDRNILMTVDFNTDLSSLEIESGIIMEIDFISLSDIDELSTAINWNADKSIEFLNMDESLADPGLDITFSNYIPSIFSASYETLNDRAVLTIESPYSQECVIRWVSSNGTIVKENVVSLLQGSNFVQFDHDFIPGLYFVQIQTPTDMTTLREFID